MSDIRQRNTRIVPSTYPTADSIPTHSNSPSPQIQQPQSHMRSNQQSNDTDSLKQQNHQSTNNTPATSITRTVNRTLMARRRLDNNEDDASHSSANGNRSAPPSPVPASNKSARNQNNEDDDANNNNKNNAAALTSTPDRALSRELVTFHQACIVVFWIQGLVFYISGNDAPVPVTQTIHVGSTEGKLQQRVDEFGSIRLSTLVNIYFASAGCHHFLTVYVFFKSYALNLQQHYNYLRWSEYIFSSTMMIVLLGLLVGMRDLYILLMLGCCQVTCILFGLLFEKHHNDILAHFAGWIPFLLEWAIIFHQYFSSKLNGGEISNYVDFLVPVQFVSFCGFGAVQMLQGLQIAPFDKYIHVEVAFMVLSIMAKTIMGCSIFLGLLYI